MNKILVASMAVCLQDLDNKTLAAANITLSWLDRLPAENIAFNGLHSVELINDDGRPCDKESLLDALALVIDTRIESGQWE